MEDIRAELLDEHRRQREQKQRDLQNKLDNAKVTQTVFINFGILIEVLMSSCYTRR